MQNNRTKHFSLTPFTSTGLICLLFFVLLAAAISCKAYYHTDEFQSYLIANRTLTPQPGHSYDAYGQPSFSDCRPIINAPLAPYTNLNFMMSAYDCFNYRRVWQNASHELTPPIYVALLHTICSFFPGYFSRWFAGIINIFFALATLLVIRKMMRLFTDDKFVITAVSLVFACSSAIINACAFLRMYIMAMFWMTLQTYILVQYADKELDKRFYINIFLVSLFGSLTHHYCSMYFVFSSAIFALCLLKDKKFKDLGKCCAVALCVPVADVALFPAFFNPFFHGSLAGMLAANVSAHADFSYRLAESFSYINNELFGAMLPLIAAALILSCILRRRRLQDADVPSVPPHTRQYLLAFVPPLLFTLVIATTYVVLAYQNNFRHYITPATALLLAIVLLFTFTRLTQCMKQRAARGAIVLLSVLLVCGSWLNVDWTYDFLYRGYFDTPVANAYADADCIVIGSPAYPAMYETMRYATQTCFNTAEDFTKSQFYPQFLSQNKLVLYFAPHKYPDEDLALRYVLGNNISQYTITKVPLYCQDPLAGGTDCMYYIERAGGQNMMQQTQ